MKILSGIFLLLCCLAAPVLATENARFAYTTNDVDASLARYSVDPGSGQLRFIDYLPLGKNPPEVVIDPSGRYLLALSQSINRLFVYRIDHQNGALTPVPGSPFDVKGAGPFNIAFHPTGRFFYIALRFSGVGAYAFDPGTGAVTSLPGSPYPAQERTRAVALTPAGHFLYALNSYVSTISAFEVDAQTGALSTLPGFPIPVGTAGEFDYRYLSEDVPSTAGAVPYHMLIEARGRFVLVSNLAGGTVSVFRINSDSGQLKEVDGSPFFAGFNPHSIALHPNGRFVYAIRGRDSVIEVLELNSGTGRLTQVPGSPYETGGQGPAEIVFSDQGQRAYVINWDSNDVAQMDVNTDTGALSVREVVKTRSGPWSFVLAEGDKTLPARAAQVFAALGEKGLGQVNSGDLSGVRPQLAVGNVNTLAVGPGQRLIYAIDRVAGSLTALSLNKAGDMEFVTDGRVATGKGPSDVVIDRNGWYAYVTNAGDNTMSVYYIDAESGQPRSIKGSPFNTGKQPTFISLDPAARYAYVVNTGDDTISVYRYRSNVTPLVFETVYYGSPFATGKAPVGIEIDPTGRYAYVANAGSNDVSAYRINHQTGALSDLPGSPFKAGQKPRSLLAHPDGQWLFVANHDSADVSVFRIETTLGALADVGKVLKLPFKPGRLQWNSADERLVVLADDGAKWLTFSLDVQTGMLARVTEKSLKIPFLDFFIMAQP
ncbi:MAG: beta-propeller fold lactonase family protein [Gammaproteobacteria bacterium]|nr:beta-propeller fold lactonase family protein [Gammaproteobacteria bacterium]